MTDLLVDTGAEISVIKTNSVRENTNISKNDNIQIETLSGQIPSIGTCQGTFSLNSKFPCKFHVVGENANIRADGILGNNFLSIHCNIEKTERENVTDRKSNYSSQPIKVDTFPRNMNTSRGIRPEMKSSEYGVINGKVPPRSEIFLSLKARSNKDMLCLAQEVVEGVYMGNALVRPINNKIIVSLINVNNHAVELKNVSPMLESLEDYEILNINTSETISDRKKGPINGIKKLFLMEQKKEEARDEHKQKLERLEIIKEIINVDKSLNEEEEHSLHELLGEFQDIFHLPGDLLTHTHSIQHKIPMKVNQEPINQKAYRLPERQREIINSQVEKMTKEGIIETSKSPWNSPLLVVPKKPGPDGQKRWRVVVDYRKLNSSTIGDAYPLPRIEDILDQLGHSRYFSTLDLASGYHQIEVDEVDREKTAFSTPYGHFQFRRMPFGLKGAPATFQRLMNYVLTGLQGIKCFVYLDDVVIYAKNLADHQNKLREVFKRLRDWKFQTQCKEFNTTMYICYLNEPMFILPDGQNNCIFKLFQNPFIEPPECTHRIITGLGSMIVPMEHKNSWIYWLQEPTYLYCQCFNEESSFRLIGVGIFKLLQNCVFRINNYMIPFKTNSLHELIIQQPKEIMLPEMEKYALLLQRKSTNKTFQKLKVLDSSALHSTLNSNSKSVERLELELSQMEISKTNNSLKNKFNISLIIGVIALTLCCFYIAYKVKLRSRKIPNSRNSVQELKREVISEPIIIPRREQLIAEADCTDRSAN